VSRWILALAGILVAACGSLTADVSRSPSPAPSALRTRVERLAPALSFAPFAPDDTGTGFDLSVSLVARPVSRDQQQSAGMGEPLLLVQLSIAGGGKPALTMIQGPEGCCAEMVRLTAPSEVTIRATPPIHGQLGSAANTNTDARTLTWLQPAGSGRSTFIALLATPFGPQFDEAGLLRVARSMRAVDRGASGQAIVLYFSTHISHSPTGHRVFVAPGAAPLPEQARLIDGAGQVIATAGFEAPKSYDCLHAAAGVAALAVPQNVVERFARQNGDAGYRVEARIGGAWKPVELVASGCASIE
jgi:hypothetical protein